MGKDFDLPWRLIPGRDSNFDEEKIVDEALLAFENNTKPSPRDLVENMISHVLNAIDPVLDSQIGVPADRLIRGYLVVVIDEMKSPRETYRLNDQYLFFTLLDKNDRVFPCCMLSSGALKQLEQFYNSIWDDFIEADKFLRNLNNLFDRVPEDKWASTYGLEDRLYSFSEYAFKENGLDFAGLRISE